MDPTAPPELSLVIMAKDEEENLTVTIPEIDQVARTKLKVSYELFLVDGHSSDRTVEVARSFGVRVVQVGGGKGAGIIEALRIAQGKYILFIDADHSHVPEDIPRLLNAIQVSSCHMVVASRMLGGSQELHGASLDNYLRLLGNRSGTFLVNLRWGCHLTDIQNGFRILDRETALSLGLEEKSFSIEQETVMKCLKRKKRIAEIPSFERQRLHGQSKISKRKEFWKYLQCFLRNL